MMRPPERVEIPEEEDLKRQRFARILAVLIVIATLGVASAEYLHSIADKNADAAGVKAQQLSIERQGDLVRAEDAARASIDNYAYSEQQRTQQANAFQEYLAPSIQTGTPQATVLQLEEDRWSALAALTGDLTSIKLDGSTGPQQDVRFPNVLLSQAQKDSDITFGLQDAFNQLRADWQGRAGLLSVTLTMFAVATYLFGLSLSLQLGIRRVLVGLGVALVVGGALSTVVLQFLSPATPSAVCEITAAPTDCNQSSPAVKAAASYAAGMYDLNTFYTRTGNQGLMDADNALSAAIQQRPRFAQAYLIRSEVRFLMGSPQRDSLVLSLTTAAALQSQGNDLQTAYDLGLRDKLLLNNLAANRLLQAIATNRSDYYGQALSYVNAALALDANDPLLYYNKGLALLGQGNTDAAQHAYQDAVAHTLYTDVNAKTKRNDAAAEEAQVSGALTPLDLLAGHRSDLASQVNAMKTLIVNGVARNQAAPGGIATMSMTALQVFPGELQWTADIANFDPAKDSISTQFYYEDPQKLGWAVLPSISGVSVPTFDNATGRQNSYYLIQRFLQASSQCLQPGHYKVEVYINGHLSGTATADGTNPTLQPEAMADLAMSFCHPQGWKQDQNNFLRGFSNGFTTTDGSSGAYFVRFQNPEVAAGTDPTSEARTFRDEMLSVFSSVLPSGAGTPTIDCGDNSSGTNTLPWGPTLDASCDRQNAFFLGLSGANEGWYQYSGGFIHVGTGITSDGAVVGALVFGPSSQWSVQNEPLPDVVFDSIISTQ